MKIHRIYASDMRQGRRDVVAELGEDAVILKTQTTGGGVVIYATVSGDYELSKARAAAEAKVASRRQARVGVDAESVDDAERRRREQIALLTGQAKPKAEPRSSYSPSPARQEASRPRAQAPARERQGAPSSELARELELASQRIAGAHLKANRAEVELQQRNRQLAPEEGLGGILGPISKKVPERPRHEPVPTDDIFDDFDGYAPVHSKGGHFRRPVARTQASDVSYELESLGVSPQLSAQLSAGIEPDLSPEHRRKRVLGRLVDALDVSHADLISRGGMIAFLGATGVGKTTTIGKLAAKYVLEHGSASVALVTTDTFRIAAYEQLKTFGRILDVPVKVVNESTTLSDVLHSLRHKRLVLVDTAGLNSGEDNSEYQMSMLNAVPLRMKKLLVVSASSQRAVMDKTYATYRDVGLNGCLITKLDEAGDLGSVLSFSIEHNLTINYVTDGQRVPDDIYPARKKDLVSRALTKRAELEQLEQSMRREQHETSTKPTRFGS
ncbi:MAG: flagellar biosynthesis protein FlhF [Pontibacterium sp.]